MKNDSGVQKSAKHPLVKFYMFVQILVNGRISIAKGRWLDAHLYTRLSKVTNNLWNTQASQLASLNYFRTELSDILTCIL